MPAGAIVGIIGPNGAGKSTLFKMIAGKEKPDSGEVKIGKTVQMAFVDQHRDELANDKTVWEDVSGGLDMINIGKFTMASRAYCGRFNFNGGDQQKKVGLLSGGERGRLHLAKTLLQGGNVLLLDEPSNDLDVETLRAGRRAAGVRRQRDGDQPRPLVPGPSPPTSWPRKTRASGCSSTATTRNTKPTSASASAKKVHDRTGCAIKP